VLVLRCWTDLPVAEVADILGCSEGTVTSTASRAAARLAEALTQRAASHPNPRPATRKGKHLMPTEELEDELRRAFARAAAGIPEPEQARQRLLQRDYRPGRGHRQLAAGITAATAAAAVVLGLGLTGAFGSAPARGTGTIRTAAFTLVEHANGTATLTIKPGSILDPDTLQNDLRQYGIPAIVTTGRFCSSHPTPPGFSQVVTRQKQPRTITINPAAMPAGTELSFGNFRVAAGPETAIQLIDTNSYTCTSTAPTAPPPGGVMVGPASVSVARPVSRIK